MQSSGSFTLFPLLPAELRLQVWRRSGEGRVVEIRYSQERDMCLSMTRVPTMLHVCQESRHEGLRHYGKSFGTRSHGGEIYFSTELDILYMPRCGSMGYDDSARDFHQYVSAPVVLRLAIDHVKPEVRRPWETYNKFCLVRNFAMLKEAFLVLSSGAEDEGVRQDAETEIEFVDPAGDGDAVKRLMADVRESFRFEVGSMNCEGPGQCLAVMPKAKTTQAMACRPAFVSCM